MKSTALSAIPLRPDLCIIGAGPAGLALATAAAALSVPTLVIDKEDLRSALPRAGEVAGFVLRAAARQRAGSAGGPSNDWDDVRGAARAAAETRATSMSAVHLRALGLTVLRGTARFVDSGTVEVDGVSIRPRRFVVATGALAAIPALPGLERVPWSCATRWLDLPALPRSLVVLGAGRTGVEFAQIFARLGTRVTLVEGAAPLRGFDAELSAPVLTRLRREGVDIRTGRTVLRAEPEATGVTIVMSKADGTEERVRGDHLLLATGWRPAIDDLRLDRAGIRCDPGGIAVSADGRTGNPKVFALGNVVGRGRSIESAQAQVGVVLRAALFRQRVSFDPRSVPRILRTDPEIAVVGLTETEARVRHGTVTIWRWPYAENDRARAEGMTTGHVKVLTTPSGRIVGAGIVGPDAAEGIGLWTLAIAQSLNIKDIAALPLPSLSYEDASRRAALQGMVAGFKGPWLQRAMKVVRWMG